MPDDNPNLIPPPSIGESKPSASPDVKIAKPKGSMLWLVVLICVVAGIGLGVFVYQKSIAPAPTPSKKPVASVAPKTPAPSLAPASPIATASAEPAGVNAISPQSNTVVFPKAGEVRVYFGGYGSNPTVSGQLIRLTSSTGEADVTMPGSVPAGNKMAYGDSGLDVTAGQSVTIQSFDRGDTGHPSYGWIKPSSSNKCGASYDTDASPMISWATTKSAGEPLVSVQCWGDWGGKNDTSNTDYNDFLIILSYVPASQQTSPSPSSATVSPSPSPSHTPSPTPSPSDTAEETSSPASSSTTRVTMPEGSSLPSAGVFEVTVGTVGVGLILILLGGLGLLLL